MSLVSDLQSWYMTLAIASKTARERAALSKLPRAQLSVDAMVFAKSQ